MSRSAAVSIRGGRFHDYTRLDDTSFEIAAIDKDFKRQFGDVNPVELSGTNATESAVRKAATAHRYLHLATHGFFADDAIKPQVDARPGSKTRSGSGLTDRSGSRTPAGCHPGLLSGLALTGANVQPTPAGKDDGILTALEVAELDLSGVELAVLSACQTGLGKVAGGEGLLGLQRAIPGRWRRVGRRDIVGGAQQRNGAPDGPVLQEPLGARHDAPRRITTGAARHAPEESAARRRTAARRFRQEGCQAPVLLGGIRAKYRPAVNWRSWHGSRRCAGSDRGDEPGVVPRRPRAVFAASSGGEAGVLVGCTSYESLSQSRWLRGPANDVALMRSLLMEEFGFAGEAIVTLAEGPETDRPSRAISNASSSSLLNSRARAIRS